MAPGVAFAIGLILVVGQLQEGPGTLAKTFTFPEYPYKETTKNAVRTGLRGERRLQDAATAERQHRQDQMHSRMRLAILLQRNLLVRSARGRGDRREIKLLQGLLHAAQRTAAKVTKTGQQARKEAKARPKRGRTTAKMSASTNSKRQAHRTNRVRPVPIKRTFLTIHYPPVALRCEESVHAT